MHIKPVVQQGLFSYSYTKMLKTFDKILNLSKTFEVQTLSNSNSDFVTHPVLAVFFLNARPGLAGRFACGQQKRTARSGLIGSDLSKTTHCVAVLM